MSQSDAVKMNWTEFREAAKLYVTKNGTISLKSAALVIKSN